MGAVTAQMTYKGQPMSVLHSLIEARRKFLNESVRDSVAATAILCVKSLRADTRIAKKKAKNTDVEVSDTGWVGGWRRVGDKFRRVACTANGARVDVHPVNRAGRQYVKGERVKVFKVVPHFHKDDWKWDKNRNAKDRCWYVFAQSRKVAVDYGKERMQRYINRWRGLARMALGFAMAKLSTRAVKVDPVSAKAKTAAEMNAHVSHSADGGMYTTVVIDSLRYARKSLKSGPGAVELALKKAANSIAGRIRKTAGGSLDMKFPTPFPEVKGRK